MRCRWGEDEGAGQEGRKDEGGEVAHALLTPDVRPGYSGCS